MSDACAAELKAALLETLQKLGLRARVFYDDRLDEYCIDAALALPRRTLSFDRVALAMSRDPVDLIASEVNELQRALIDDTAKRMAEWDARGRKVFGITAEDKTLLHDMYENACFGAMQNHAANPDAMQRYQALMERLFK